MRMSDWSSDVCSSDLDVLVRLEIEECDAECDGRPHPQYRRNPLAGLQRVMRERDGDTRRQQQNRVHQGFAERGDRLERAADIGGAFKTIRSEEHTSELQSLMRISYAVFCLEKKIIPGTYAQLIYLLLHTTTYLFTTASCIVYIR